MPPRRRSMAEVEAAAARYEVTTRTIYRWLEAGVDIDSLEAVADYLLCQHAPSPAAMTAINTKLQ